ncbi:MAG: PEP-CTERM sorting domain-containing protein [Verrucomicrobiota bacterium]|nr:PEP-CTERM sorting domain-containing protein [Verrucomicrobiota bacterium]
MNKPSLKNTASKGLVGALAIAGGTQAYGAVVKVGPPPSTTIPVGTNTTGGYDPTYPGDVAWDVDGNGSNDFYFRLRYPGVPASGTGVEWQADFNPFTSLSATNGIISYQAAFLRYGTALQAGVSVGPGGPFSAVGQIVLGSRYFSSGTPTYYAGFAAGPNGNNAVPPGTLAYAGFRFAAPDGTHYGWIQLSVSAGHIDFVSAAYESTPGTAITTGAVPEPSTLAMLALGATAALGTVIKRRRS